MTTYELAKLVLMADGVDSRKRLQKTVHLLQAAGCDFGLEFRLHYYGPYCSELAELIDWMSADDILIESKRQTSVGTQYDYRLNANLRDNLESFEETSRGQVAKTKLEGFQKLLDELRDTPPRVLELASTIVVFRQNGKEWPEALKRTAEFKQEDAHSLAMKRAFALAKSVLSCCNG